MGFLSTHRGNTLIIKEILIFVTVNFCVIWMQSHRGFCMSPSIMFIECVFVSEKRASSTVLCVYVHVLESVRKAGDIGGGGVVPLVGHTLLCL